MDLRYSDSDEAFRKELREWLAEAVPAHGSPPDAADWAGRRAYDTGWQRKLYDAGYAGINWPKEYGGRDASLTEQLVYYEESARARAPYIGVNFVGILHGGPTLISEGTDVQKERHIGPILRGEQVWCQGFSEPGAGSDLAALKTRAERDGDHYVLNGHKIWTSFAQVADYCELLVRTDPDARKHRGISWLGIPMGLEGMEIRPLPTLTGEGEFSEVFLENVRVPVDCLVGAENDGWRVTNVTLAFERGTAFATDMVVFQEVMRELAAVAKRVTRNGAAAWEDRSLRAEVGHLAAEVEAVWAMVKYTVSEADRTGVPSVSASGVKLYFTELKQRIGETCMRVLGRATLSREDVDGLPCQSFVYEALQSLSMTIAAGSSQIQRNIISERILGLPREPR
ncbi:MAG: acyl-CoA dehydrogenase family protein [Myxococcales bacterium]|nr:acyl-CoA dehydrogenase family protein [Myxococcales bacterium]